MSQTASPPRSYRIRIVPSADGGGRIPDLSPREARDRWINRLRTSPMAESSVSSYHYRTKLFVEFCEDKGINSIGDLTGWDIDSFENERRGAEIDSTSLNNEIDTLLELLKYCARIGLVDENLSEKIDVPEVPKGDNVSKTKLDTDRAKALLDYYDSTPEERHTRAHAMLASAWYVTSANGSFPRPRPRELQLRRTILRIPPSPQPRNATQERG